MRGAVYTGRPTLGTGPGARQPGVGTGSAPEGSGVLGTTRQASGTTAGPEAKSSPCHSATDLLTTNIRLSQNCVQLQNLHAKPRGTDGIQSRVVLQSSGYHPGVTRLLVFWKWSPQEAYTRYPTPHLTPTAGGGTGATPRMKGYSLGAGSEALSRWTLPARAGCSLLILSLRRVRKHMSKPCWPIGGA